MGMLSASVCFGSAASFRSAAQPSNARPIRMLVGFAPGGSVDVLARLLVEQMKDYAPSLIVENRAGAGGRLALEALRNSPADGQTLLLTPSDPITFSPHVYRSASYRASRDFVPVAMVAAAPFIVAVGPAIPQTVATVDQFIAYCRSYPRIATFGTPGAGSRPHFIGAMLARSAGFEFVHVPYNGAAPAIQDMLRGEIGAAITTIANVLPHIQAGAARALVTTAPRRGLSLPSTPTMRETGYSDLEVVEWFGVMAPPGTLPAAVEAAAMAVTRALRTDEVERGLSTLSFEPEFAEPAGLAAGIQAEIERWGSIINASGFRP